MTGSTIHHYTTERELGRGGMATVFLAHDNKFDTHVAIKVLNKEFVHNDNIRKRFLAEARNMFKMSHPNIVKVTDLIDDGDLVAFVMEYIEGETLKEYLDKKGKLGDEEIRAIFIQMLDGVGYVHKQNLVHRDIKPSNFMIDGKGRVKLMDFGIAKNTDTSAAEYTQTGTGMQMGTPMYMSPEQITETKSVTAQSDIYSLGVVLWQMAAGRKPYDVKTLSSFQLQTKIVNEPLIILQSGWDDIIQKATAKTVAKRFKSTLEILDLRENGGSFKTKLDASENTLLEEYKSRHQTTTDNESYTKTKPGQNIIKEKKDRNSEVNSTQNNALKTIIAFIVILLSLIICYNFYINYTSETGPFSDEINVVPVPYGFRYPSGADIVDDWTRTLSDPSKKPYIAVGDFNSDNVTDTARILVNESDPSRGKLFVLMNINGNTGYTEIEAIDEDLRFKFISTVEPDKYITACGKGYWECEPGEPAEVNLTCQAFVFGNFDAGGTQLIYYDFGTKSFTSVTLDD